MAATKPGRNSLDRARLLGAVRVSVIWSGVCPGKLLEPWSENALD